MFSDWPSEKAAGPGLSARQPRPGQEPVYDPPLYDTARETLPPGSKVKWGQSNKFQSEQLKNRET